MPAPPALRIVFAGTPAFAARHLEALLARQEFAPVAICTRPDRRAGRGRRQRDSAVKQCALQHGLPLLQPARLDEDAGRALAQLRPDLLLVVAYGILIPQHILDLPRYGCINVHASLLPRWRGAAPVEYAIAAGDRRSGISIMQMNAGLDTGDILLQRSCPIHPDDSGDSLRERLADLGCQMLLEMLPALLAGTLHPTPQEESGARNAARLSRAEARIDWGGEAAAIGRRIRAFYSANPCYTFLEDKRIGVLAAALEEAPAAPRPPGEILASSPAGLLVACGSGALRLQRLQLPGGKEQPVAALLNAYRPLFAPGTRFTS